MFLTCKEMVGKYKHFGLTIGKLEIFVKRNKLRGNRPTFINWFHCSTINKIENETIIGEINKDDIIARTCQEVINKISKNKKIDVIKRIMMTKVLRIY